MIEGARILRDRIERRRRGESGTHSGSFLQERSGHQEGEEGRSSLQHEGIEVKEDELTFTVNISGHDDLQGDAKAAFENDLVEQVNDLVAEIKSGEGVNVTSAQVTTNTTGTVDVLNS